MTGCRLLRSTSLSCKCFSFAVLCDLWIWNLLKVLHTVILWGYDHPPFGEHGPASGGGAKSGARRWRAGQTGALKYVCAGDLVLPSYAEYASEAAQMETIQSFLLPSVCCPSFTGVEDCAQDACSVHMHLVVHLVVPHSFAIVELGHDFWGLRDSGVDILFEGEI